MRLRAAPFVILLTLAILLAPRPADAQQAGKVWRIGVLAEERQSDVTENLWRDRLRRSGYVEGKNIALSFRFRSERREALANLAAELVAWKADIILAESTPSAVAAKRATITIPIITVSGDPVGAGLVEGFARPGGNVTGLFIPSADLATKRLQLLVEAVPDLSRISIVWNPENEAANKELGIIQAAARSLRITTHAVELRAEADTDTAFAAIMSARSRGILLVQDPITFRVAGRMAEFSLRHRLPASYAHRMFVDSGGLMSYGPALGSVLDAVVDYMDRVLKGARPADLPMQQPTKFEFAVNLKTAKALGLTIPQSLLLRADQIIE